jgi:hypothetical protein
MGFWTVLLGGCRLPELKSGAVTSSSGAADNPQSGGRQMRGRSAFSPARNRVPGPSASFHDERVSRGCGRPTLS